VESCAVLTIMIPQRAVIELILQKEQMEFDDGCSPEGHAGEIGFFVAHRDISVGDPNVVGALADDLGSSMWIAYRHVPYQPAVGLTDDPATPRPRG
jgi:hypothetical protein